MSSPSPLVFHFKGIPCHQVVCSNYSQFRDVNDVFNMLLLKNLPSHKWLVASNKVVSPANTAKGRDTPHPLPTPGLSTSRQSWGGQYKVLPFSGCIQFAKSKKRSRRSLDTHPQLPRSPKAVSTINRSNHIVIGCFTLQSCFILKEISSLSDVMMQIISAHRSKSTLFFIIMVSFFFCQAWNLWDRKKTKIGVLAICWVLLCVDEQVGLLRVDLDHYQWSTSGNTFLKLSLLRNQVFGYEW